ERLQAELWSAILPTAKAQPTPLVALVAAGMNDMLNAQGHTQGAWWNRIPLAAWGLMGFIAIACNLLVGYNERRRGALLLLVIPIIVSISVLLIAWRSHSGSSAQPDLAIPIHERAIGK